MKTFFFCFSILLAVIEPASAHVLLPANTFRSQGEGGDFNYHCWAYVASIFLEVRSELITGVATTIETERDLMYWIYYDRFMQRYKTKSPLPEIADKNLLTPYGMPQEYFSAFFEHGFYVHSSFITQGEVRWNFYDHEMELKPFIPYPLSPGKKLNVDSMLKAVLAASSEKEADQILRGILDESIYRRTDSAPADAAQKMFGDAAAKIANDPLIWVGVVEENDPSLHKWVDVYGGKFKEFDVTKEEVEILAKKSLDLKIPILRVNNGHIWVEVGYDGDMFAIADPLWKFYFSSEFKNASIITTRSVIERVMPQFSLPASSSCAPALN